MTKELECIPNNKQTLSDEYRALLRAAEAAKKQAELLGLPFIKK